MDFFEGFSLWKIHTGENASDKLINCSHRQIQALLGLWLVLAVQIV